MADADVSVVPESPTRPAVSTGLQGSASVPSEIVMTRRELLGRLLRTPFAGAGGLVLAFLWAGCTSTENRFGGVVTAGRLTDILGQIRRTREPVYVLAARAYVNPFPVSALPAARDVAAYSKVLSGYEAGVVALYQKCVHLGCRVPWCKTSQWFECPCHGSKYNRVGEKKGGPAPRGLDRFAVRIEGGNLSIDTRTIVVGPPIGTDTTRQEADGPHCVSIG